MSKKWPKKDPDELLDYTVDWTARLVTGDAIAASSWIVPLGIDQETVDFNDTEAIIWLSGGTEGVTYSFVNRVNTAGGRIMDQTVTLGIKTR